MTPVFLRQLAIYSSPILGTVPPEENQALITYSILASYSRLLL
jgi:hypothetical protein